MNKLKKMDELGISINWKTINTGWRGLNNFSRQLYNRDVIEYAQEEIARENNINDKVLALASCYDNETNEIDKLLLFLSKDIVSTEDIEIKKWSIILLTKLLDSISSIPLEGLLELTEFWSMFDYPQFSPHILQGVNNNISPKEYYTEENYKHIKDSHMKWIEQELMNIKKCEQNNF